MDYLVPALMFAVGFGVALLAKRVVWPRGLGGRSAKMPVEKGAVRLDEVGRKRKKHRK